LSRTHNKCLRHFSLSVFTISQYTDRDFTYFTFSRARRCAHDFLRKMRIVREMHVHHARCEIRTTKRLRPSCAHGAVSTLTTTIFKTPTVRELSQVFFFNTDLSVARDLLFTLRARHCTFFYHPRWGNGEWTS